MTAKGLDRRGAALVAITAALLAGFAFAIGGTVDEVRTGTTFAIAVLIITSAFAYTAYRGRIPRPFSGSIVLLFSTLLSAIAAVSVGWSIVPSNSLFNATLTITYTAILAAAALAAQLLRGRNKQFLGGVVVAALIICVYALLSRIEPGWFNPADDFARLRMPFGYWNAVGIAGVFGLLGSLWIGTTRQLSRAYVVFSYPAGGIFFVVLALSQSRGAVAAALISVAIWLLVAPRRLRSIGWLVIVAVVGVVVVAWAYSTPALSTDAIPLPQREHTGAQFGLVSLAMIVALVGLGIAVEKIRNQRSLTAGERARITRVLLVCLAISPFLLVTYIGFGTTDGLKTISNGVSKLFDPSLNAPPNSPNRLTQTSSLRARYWSDAFKIFKDHTFHGTGGDTFGVARLPFSGDVISVQHAHGYVPQMMSDFGVLGLALSILMGVGWLTAGTRALGGKRSKPTRWLDRADDERLALVAIALIAFAYGFHSTIDWTWFVPGVTVFGLATGGWVLGLFTAPYVARTATTSAATVEIPELHPTSTTTAASNLLRAAGITLVGIAMAIAVYQPAHGLRKVNQGNNLLASGHPERALAAGKKAHQIDPTSDEAYYLIAVAQNNLDDTAAAEKTLEQIAATQPANPETWRHLADYRLNTLSNPVTTFEALRALLYLSPSDARGNAMLAQAKQLRITQLVNKAEADQKRAAAKQFAKLKKQAIGLGGPSTTLPTGPTN